MDVFLFIVGIVRYYDYIVMSWDGTEKAQILELTRLSV